VGLDARTIICLVFWIVIIILVGFIFVYVSFKLCTIYITYTMLSFVPKKNILDTRFELKLEANLLYYGYCSAFDNLFVHSLGVD
jgi:hypothetical protein